MIILLWILNSLISFSQISNPNSVNFQLKSSAFQNKNTLLPPVKIGFTADDIIKQQYDNAMKGMGYNPPKIPTADNPFPNQNYQSTQTQSQKELKNILDELDQDEARLNNVPKTLEATEQKNKIVASYKAVFEEIMKMDRGEIAFSLTKAVFMVENVYSDYKLNYTEYSKMISAKVDAINYLIRKEKIGINNQLGKNYIIQKVFSEKITFQNRQGLVKEILPYSYDFEDFYGEENWTQMFVSKLLKTGKGQCHSLPLLYLILAEQTNTEAWLSLAPEHTYIQFQDKNSKKWYNFETTNGNNVSTNWIMELGYISSEAIKNRIYLDTLSKQGLISILLSDLTMGYIDKIGYDEMSLSFITEIERLCPNNIQAQMLKADEMTLQTQKMFSQYRNPPIEQISNFPELEKQYNSLLKQYEYIDNLGYTKMPEEKYQAWLASINQARMNESKQTLNKTIKENVSKNN